MFELEIKLEKHMTLLIDHYPMLESIKRDIILAYSLMELCYNNLSKVRKT